MKCIHQTLQRSLPCMRPRSRFSLRKIFLMHYHSECSSDLFMHEAICTYSSDITKTMVLSNFANIFIKKKKNTITFIYTNMHKQFSMNVHRWWWDTINECLVRVKGKRLILLKSLNPFMILVFFYNPWKHGL